MPRSSTGSTSTCRLGASVAAAGLIAIAGCNAPGTPDAPAANTETSDARVIAGLEVRAEEAHRTGDIAFLDSLYAPTFRFVHSTGDVEERPQRLSALANREVVTVRRSVDSLEVELHGDVALSTGRIHVITADEDPEWREYTVRYARVYAFRGGRWRLLTHHSTGLTFGPPE